MEDSEIQKRFEEYENRIKALEKKVFGEKSDIKSSDEFDGLNGGINLLIKNNFLNSPKPLQEIKSELSREGYHYGSGAISKALSVYFMKDKKSLTRTKDGKLWKYVVRK